MLNSDTIKFLCEKLLMKVFNFGYFFRQEILLLPVGWINNGTSIYLRFANHPLKRCGFQQRFIVVQVPTHKIFFTVAQ